MAKTVKFQGSFAVFNAAGVASPNKPISDLDTTVNQVMGGDPSTVPGGTTDWPLCFGTITGGKRIYLNTDYEVTVKVQQNTDIGFPWRGIGVLPSYSGITGVWITTGPNDTTVEFVIAGD